MPCSCVVAVLLTRQAGHQSMPAKAAATNTQQSAAQLLRSNDTLKNKAIAQQPTFGSKYQSLLLCKAVTNV
jgi:hypothetical protein